jgi:hypothetical protein
MSQRRVLAGVPAGGQFAPTRRPESSLDLEDGDEILEAARRSVSHWARSRRPTVDISDLTQEVCLSYVAAMNRGGGESVQNRRGYIHKIARQAVASHSFSGDRMIRSEEREALAKLRSRVDAIQQELGRELTDAEVSAIADDVRAAQPPGRRARSGFERPVVRVHFDDWGSIPEPEAAIIAHSDFGEGSTGAHVERLAASSNRKDQSDARRMSWDALAELSSAPPVRSGVSERQIANARRFVAAAGGVAAAIERWESGDTSATKAIFAPFATETESGRAQVVALLRKYPAYTDDLWDAAARGATKRRPS